MNDMWKNIWQAICLKEEFFKQVKSDESLTQQSYGVIILSAIATGFWPFFVDPRAIVFVMMFFVIWFANVLSLYIIGGKLFKESQTDADYNTVFRVMGYASAPSLIRLLSPVPVIGYYVEQVSYIWMLVVFIVAAKVALNYKSQVRTVLVCLGAWLVPMLISWLFVLISGPVLMSQVFR